MLFTTEILSFYKTVAAICHLGFVGGVMGPHKGPFVMCTLETDQKRVLHFSAENEKSENEANAENGSLF